MVLAAFPAQAVGPSTGLGTGKKPNTIVIFADEVGIWNISAYYQGMMGYKTPNDRLFLLLPVPQFLVTFRDFPSRQKPGSFSLEQVLEKLQQGSNK